VRRIRGKGRLLAHALGVCAAATTMTAALATLAGTAEASAPVAFTVVNGRGVPQFSYYIVEPARHAAPRPSAWQRAAFTSPVGQVTISVSAGERVYFARTAVTDDRHGTLVPPEGRSGQAYRVTASTPSRVTITLPVTGSAYHPRLSPREEWLLGQINARRVRVGAPALRVSTTLARGASEEARDEALHHRWPDPFFYVINQDFGWPGDIADEGYGTADAPFSSPQRVLQHWDGDPRDRESPGIWKAVGDPYFRYAGIADGHGAWIIQLVPSCPEPNDLRACGLTDDTGDTNAWRP
jgi:hypothetical protein